MSGIMTRSKCGTETDSLSYCIQTDDLYENLRRFRSEFDFSYFPKDHNLYSAKNKKVIGKMKDEANGTVLESFVGLAPKLYSFKGRVMQKVAAKGIKKISYSNSNEA
jgi:hypothetical protein